MAQPSSRPAWVPSDDPAKVIEPSASKKNTGWQQEEKPPFQYFNWFWNNLSKWINWFNGTRKYNIVISGDSDEADFSTLASYIAGSPAVGDRVLVKNDQTLTATMAIPADVEITMVKGKKFSLSTVFTPIMNIGNRSSLRGDWEIEAGHTGVIAKAVVFNGDDSFLENFRVENFTSGTVTTAFEVAAGKIGNKAQGRSTNTGAGAITNDLVDSSSNITNSIIIRGDAGLSFVNIDADTLNGQAAAFYLALANATGNLPLAQVSGHDKAAHDALNIDADTLDSNNSSFFTNASNLNSGTLPAARFDDTAHGSRAGGALHALAVASGAAGFISGANQQKLDDISAGGGLTVQASQNVTGTVSLPTDDTYATIATSSSFSVEVDDLILIDAESNIEFFISGDVGEFFLKADKSAGTATIKPFVSRTATPLLDQSYYSLTGSLSVPKLTNRIFGIYTVTGAGTVTIQFQAKFDKIAGGTLNSVSVDAFNAGITVLR